MRISLNWKQQLFIETSYTMEEYTDYMRDSILFFYKEYAKGREMIEKQLGNATPEVIEDYKQMIARFDQDIIDFYTPYRPKLPHPHQLKSKSLLALVINDRIREMSAEEIKRDALDIYTMLRKLADFNNELILNPAWKLQSQQC